MEQAVLRGDDEDLAAFWIDRDFAQQHTEISDQGRVKPTYGQIIDQSVTE